MEMIRKLNFAAPVAACCLLLCCSLAGCDSGGGEPETISTQSELEQYLEENPNYDEGMDDASAEEDLE
tara:strand:+ start:83243 stop:83446 length:204 start_codon:yes stop_codon:yes gene_type:complete